MQSERFSPPAKAKYRFGEFILDTGARQLSHLLCPVRLTLKEFETLLLLVEYAGQSVDKETIIRRVWPDSFVAEGSLAKNISILRKQLGASSIQTLPKHGYRFALPVFRITEAERPQTAVEPEPGPLPVITANTKKSEVESSTSIGESLPQNQNLWTRTSPLLLRKTLGADVIQTHHRSGYRIAVPVVETTSNPVVPPQHLPDQGGTAPRRRGKAAAQDASRRWHPGAAFGSAIAAVFLIAVAASHLPGIGAATALVSRLAAPPIRSIVIETDGSVEPLDKGFELVHPEPRYEYEHVLYNREMNGWDRGRIRTDFMNFYMRPLNAAERDFALQRNWKLTCVCALEEGLGHANVDFGSKAARFDIEFLQEGNRYFVALTKQVSPKYEWEVKVESPGVADITRPHTYQLQFDHVTQSASLWIDGQRIYSGYRGHHQFLENRGVMFGAAIYANAKQGSFVFRTVRFEAK